MSLCWIWVVGALLLPVLQAQKHTEAELKDFIENDYENDYAKLNHDTYVILFDYFVNKSTENWNYYIGNNSQKMLYEVEVFQDWFKDLKLTDIKDETLRRKVTFARNIRESILNKETGEYKTIVDRMVDLADLSPCPIENQTCIEGSEMVIDIRNMTAADLKDNQRLYQWMAKRQMFAKEKRHLFARYIDLSDQAAKKLGYKDKVVQWTYEYETEHFLDAMENLWHDIEPLLNKLHHYLYKKCQKVYGKEIFADDNIIPILYLDEYLDFEEVPYPKKRALLISAFLRFHNFTLTDIVNLINDFYLSLGLEDVRVAAGNDSVITDHPSKDTLCKGSSWDMFDSKTFRVLFCGYANYHGFAQLFHEFGHIQYYLLYKNISLPFRWGANSGFHEALGETMLLSVYTQQYFLDRGLTNETLYTNETLINKLMFMARQRLLFLPYGYSLEKWRWEIFAGNVTEDHWNKRWWELSLMYQKVKPPMNVTEEHLDPLSNFHVAYDQQYINYYIATMLQFQLHRGFCIIAGEYDPVNKTAKPFQECNIYGNKLVGDKIREGMSLGRSRPWRDILELLIGEREVTADAMLEYFQPLVEFIDREEQNTASLIKQCVWLFLCVVYFNVFLL